VQVSLSNSDVLSGLTRSATNSPVRFFEGRRSAMTGAYSTVRGGLVMSTSPVSVHGPMLGLNRTATGIYRNVHQGVVFHSVHFLVSASVKG
jgi:hypothetical protein